jgi:uncharacterized repeat protein (TIGR03803 family)
MNSENMKRGLFYLVFAVSLLRAYDSYAQGALWGMTNTGGADNTGTLFKVNPDGTGLVVQNYFALVNPGGNPYGEMTLAGNGKLYGLTSNGGASAAGVLFEYDAATGNYSIKHEFDIVNGSTPMGSLVLATNGKLYGVASGGGANNNGVLFEYDPSTSIFIKRFDFSLSAGYAPIGSLAQAGNGKLYGMTQYGGSFESGVLFEFDPVTNICTPKFEFDGTGVNGYGPGACRLALAANGKFYGMTVYGGASDAGVIFEYEPGSTVYTKKYDFGGAQGGYPNGSLILANNGKFYGMAYQGGTSSLGVLFEYDPVTNAYSKKFDFSGTQGRLPTGDLTLAGNGKLYGTATSGGANNDGVLFEFDPSTGSYAKKIDLIASTGKSPRGSLALATNGKFYGMTFNGGATGYGVVFEYNSTSNVYTKKIDFKLQEKGATPAGNLTLTRDGKLYGLTFKGGASNVGVLFEYNPATGVYTKKYDFDGANPATPTGSLVVAGNGKLYGTASHSLFEFDPSTSTFANKYAFNGPTGENPTGSLVYGNNGKLYGTTQTGGTQDAGLLFEYDPATGITTTRFTFDGGNGGSNPFGSLVLGSNGKFYGVTKYGGGMLNAGVLFEYDPGNGMYTIKVVFDGSNGSLPNGGLVTGINGKLYGLTQYGGATGAGVIFEYDISTGSLIKKFDFSSSDGVNPIGSLALSNNGKLYGMTEKGGTANLGVLFEYDPASNTYTKKSNFTGGTNGREPSGGLLFVDTQSITFGAIPAKTFGVAPFALTATASSGLAVSYTSSNTAVATISGNTVTIVGAGTTIITASQTGSPNYTSAQNVPQTLTVNKANQTITFGALPAKTFGDVPFTLGATGAPSGVAITYASSNAAVATVSGNVVTIVGAGTTTITASQAGSPNYNAAASVPQVLTVNKASQTITFNALPDATVEDNVRILEAIGGPSGNPVTFISSDPTIANLFGNLLVFLSSGTVTITASQAGNGNYNAATPVVQPLTIHKADQVIDFPPMATQKVGDIPFDLVASSSSYLDLTFTSSNPSVATISGYYVIIVGVGTTTITASQEGDHRFNPAVDVQRTLTVNKGDQVITFNPLPDKLTTDAPFTLSAVSDSGLPVSYSSSNTNVATVSGNLVTIVGAGTTTITASQAGNANYNAAASVPQNLTINTSTVKSDQTITFNALTEKNVGDAAFNLVGSSSSGLTMSYTSSNTAVASISGNAVTIVGAGSAIITASQPGNGSYNAAVPVSRLLTVNKTTQAITFNPLADKNVGDASFNLTASASSSLAVSYSSSNTAVATISGNAITIIGAGTTIITASQSGNGNYNAATPVTRTLAVNKLEQLITFNALVDKNVGDAAFNLSATASSGLAVSYASSNTSVASISGNTVTVIGAGTTIITAFQFGNGSYSAATSASQTLTVNKTSQTIMFNSLADKNAGDASFDLAASASSGLVVTYSSSNNSVATVSGSTVTIVGGGTAIITASQSGNANYNTAAPVSQTFTVNKLNQVISFNVLTDKNVGDVAFNLTAASNSGLAVSYASSNTSVATVSGNMVTVIGAGTTIITASQSGDGNYNAATPVSQTLTVNKSNQTITFDALADKNVDDADFDLTASSSSGLTIDYSSSNTSVATVTGSTITIVGPGATIITASQPGNASYHAAADVSRALTVITGKTAQTITFNSLADKAFDDAAFNLTASATSGLAVSYVSSNLAVATVSGSTVTIIGVGTTMITASQSGNATYNAASSVSRTLTVNKKEQTISFASLVDKSVGDATFSLTASASSGLSVAYTSTSDKVSIAGTSVSIIKSGRATIIASQIGNAGYKEAASVSRSFCIRPVKPAISVSESEEGSPVLTSSAFEGNQWFLNGVAITGATSHTLTATQPGIYKVQVKIDDCVSDFSAEQPLIVTDIPESHDDNFKVEVYPNPASDWLHVSLGGMTGKKDLTIFQMSGLETASQQTEGQEARFPVTDYAKGMYVVRVKSGDQVRMIRFVKH